MKNDRRGFLSKIGVFFSGIFLNTFFLKSSKKSENVKFNLDKEGNEMSNIKNIKPLGFQWSTTDPFLFCVHHLDHYPRGNDEYGPAESLDGRNLGSDFEPKDGWRMYHGRRVPGFPVHPHRGFETITIVLRGRVDHSDSMGASGRYGSGDVQWMTAGAGVQHAEMFPLLKKDEDNTLELFQIWLNLPKKNKFAEASYKMFWNKEIPRITDRDENDKSTELMIIAGDYKDTSAIAPPPDSWAANNDNSVVIWRIKMDANAEWTLPKADADVNRTLYFYEGDKITLDNSEIERYNAVELNPNSDILVKNSNKESYLLLLQGKPINEPVVQYGPFVMNTDEEIQNAFADYRKTQFGGWPWDSNDPVHGSDPKRFAKHADGKTEYPE